jgi:choline dehydrogenase-like flavoprotein
VTVRRYDVAIIGSGPTGGYAAKALSEAGLQVVVLEAGRGPFIDRLLHLQSRLRRKAGYLIEEDPAAIRRQPVQSSCYAWPKHPHAFVDDIDNPYVTTPETPFIWIRSRQVGGRMRVEGHGLQFYRFSDEDFNAGARDGASPSWPLGYADLAPYYERVERWMQLHGTCDGLPQLPDSLLAGKRTLNVAEARLRDVITSRWPDRTLIVGRTARPPVPINDALATGRCRLRTNAVVTGILTDDRSSSVTGVRFVERVTRQTREVSAAVVILCASAIESARLLLASATREQPDGLANSSGVVGRFLMDHTHLSGIHGTMPLDEPVRTRSWSYIPRFRNVGSKLAPFVRGYGIQVFTMWRECAFTCFGEMLPHPDNRVTVDRDRTDTWGVPIARISCVHRENERAMEADQIEACVETLTAAGVRIADFRRTLSLPGLASHEMGTVRMGLHPKQSALNGFCQSWDVKNLFVMDGACFVTQAVQNPTLTMMAIAARASDYVVESFKRGDFSRV